MKIIHHGATEDTEDNETKKISEILCALCVRLRRMVNPVF
jgi:hypothetical protein